MAKKPAVAVDVRKAYAQALTRGRRQAQKGDLDAAVATFQAALSLSPNDGRVLSELGVVAQRQGDLALAEKWTRQSIAATSDPQVRGASLYNLGRIEEARGDNAAAVEAYKRSLQSRPNHLVRARLATLDPTAAAELDPFAPRLMAGPFPSVSAWCGQQLGAVKKERQGELRDDDFACDTDGDDSTWRATRLGGPWAEARIVVTRTAEVGNRDEEYHVAVRQADQWYVSPSLWSTTDGERHETNVGLLRFEVGDVVAGGAPQLTVHARVEESSYGGWGSSETERELLAFVGVGPSGRPSASAPIAVASRVTEDGVSPFDGDGRDDPRTTAYKLGWRVQPSGEIELSLGEHEGKLDPGLTADVLGTHRILFP